MRVTVRFNRSLITFSVALVHHLWLARDLACSCWFMYTSLSSPMASLELDQELQVKLFMIINS